MTYDSVWERLNKAARRVMDATGCSKQDAQADICRAVADGVIRIRSQLKKQATGHMTSRDVLEGPAFEIQPTIKPDDLDWEQSRPLKPWLVKSGAHRLPGFWNLDWIELSRTDVASVLCAPRERVDAEHPTSHAKQRAVKGRPTFERAKRAVNELYPDGPPNQAALPNKQLFKQVGQKLKNQQLPPVSNDTILRAAGRRRK